MGTDKRLNRLSSAINDKRLLYPLAAVCFTAITVYLFILVTRGFGYNDEAFLLTLPHRYLKGDRMIIEEWHISQFSSPFIYLPVKIYYSLFGTEGILLFARRLFICCHVATSVFLFVRLRDYGMTALIASLTFCHFVFIPDMIYYTESLMFSVMLCSLLFLGKPLRPIGYFIVGIIAACDVLSEPIFAVVYFLYAAVAVVRLFFKKYRKKPGLLGLKTFLLITAGIVATAIVFLTYLFTKGTLKEYIEAFPNFFTDSEYAFPILSDKPQTMFSLDGITAILVMGPVYYVIEAVLFLVVLIDRNRHERRPVYLTVVGIFNIIFLIHINKLYIDRVYDKALLVTIIPRYIPLFLFGLFAWLLLEDKKNNKNLLYWLISGFVYSQLFDIASDAYIICFLMGGVFVNPAVLIMIKKIVGEIRAEIASRDGTGKDTAKEKARGVLQRVAIAALCLVVASAPLGEIGSFIYEMKYPYFEHRFGDFKDEKLDTKIERGPYKGLVTVPSAAKIYEKLMDDMDAIKDGGDGAFYVYDYALLFLYVDRPYSVYSAWYVDRDFESRQLLYWKLHPDKFPEYVYIPKYECRGFFNITNLAPIRARYGDFVEMFEVSADTNDPTKDRLRFWTKNYDCEVTESDVGYTLRIIPA